MPADLYGPAGLLVALVIAVGWLWRDHLRSDEEDRKQRDAFQALNEAIVPALRELTQAVTETTREAATRHRRGDE